MNNKENVFHFLEDFKTKLNIWDVIFRDDRGKNTQTLLALELPAIERKNILAKLQLEDFSEGPLEEKLYKGSEMWIFGKNIKGYEIYIKISLGMNNSNVLCISFHVAEHPMIYPFK
jgi:hypothetical protein